MKTIVNGIGDCRASQLVRTAAGALLLTIAAIAASVTPAAAQEQLCDNSFEDCRAEVLRLIRNETVGLDVSYWFLVDHRYSDEIIRRRQAGVPVRVILDLRADANYPANATRRQALINAGIPIRSKVTAGINHWKMMLFAGQNKVQFSAANYAESSLSPQIPYTSYVDEAIFFTDDPSIVSSFMTKFDDLWTDTTHYNNVANVTTLSRNYPTSPLDAELNFPPDRSYMDRVNQLVRQETVGIDVAMFRITSSLIPDELILKAQQGVPVRLITDKAQYRNTAYFWHSYNVEKMYMAGIPVKWKITDSGQDMHQKSILFKGLGRSVFGSSNWTASSSNSQREHNYFASKASIFQWFVDQFERKWNNLKAPVDGGGPVTPAQFVDFEPGFPEVPVYASPGNGALGQGASVTVRWEGGWWAHTYDIYFGTSPTPPLAVQDFAPGSSTAGVTGVKESYAFASLQPGVTYYWRIVGKTVANRTRSGATYSFTTSGGSTIPPAPASLSATAVSPTRIDLTWADGPDEEGYKVERKLSSSSSWTQIALIGANISSYQDTNSGLAAGTTYNYRVRGYTTAGNSPYSNIATVTTPFPTLSERDVVLYAAEAPVRVGAWTVVADSTAAGGQRIYNTIIGAATVTTASPNPEHYFELSFNVQAGVGYRLWMRSKSYNNNNYNDSVHAQFSGSVTSGGSPTFRIGTTSSTWVNLQEAAGAVIQEWGWEDNGYGGYGPLVYFDTTGVQTIRVQMREDGISIDQIVLSPDTYLTNAPGANRLDATKLTKQNGAAPAPPSPEVARVVADAYVRGGGSAGTSFGAVSEMISKFSATAEYNREAYMKLDISEVQPGQTVTLQLRGWLSDTRAPSVNVRFYQANSSAWAETSLTWNNRPGSQPTVLASINVTGTSQQWYNVDLTAFVQAQRQAGASVVAIAIKNPLDTLPYSAFASREAGSNAARLIIQ